MYAFSDENKTKLQIQCPRRFTKGIGCLHYTRTHADIKATEEVQRVEMCVLYFGDYFFCKHRSRSCGNYANAFRCAGCALISIRFRFFLLSSPINLNFCPKYPNAFKFIHKSNVCKFAHFDLQKRATKAAKDDPTRKRMVSVLSKVQRMHIRLCFVCFRINLDLTHNECFVMQSVWCGVNSRAYQF